VKGKGAAYCKVQEHCRELCKNGWTDQDTVWSVDSETTSAQSDAFWSRDVTASKNLHLWLKKVFSSQTD